MPEQPKRPEQRRVKEFPEERIENFDDAKRIILNHIKTEIESLDSRIKGGGIAPREVSDIQKRINKLSLLERTVRDFNPQDPNRHPISELRTFVESRIRELETRKRNIEAKFIEAASEEERENLKKSLNNLDRRINEIEKAFRMFEGFFDTQEVERIPAREFNDPKIGLQHLLNVIDHLISATLPKSRNARMLTPELTEKEKFLKDLRKRIEEVSQKNNIEGDINQKLIQDLERLLKYYEDYLSPLLEKAEKDLKIYKELPETPRKRNLINFMFNLRNRIREVRQIVDMIKAIHLSKQIRVQGQEQQRIPDQQRIPKITAADIENASRGRNRISAVLRVLEDAGFKGIYIDYSHPDPSLARQKKQFEIRRDEKGGYKIIEWTGGIFTRLTSKATPEQLAMLLNQAIEDFFRREGEL